MRPPAKPFKLVKATPTRVKMLCAAMHQWLNESEEHILVHRFLADYGVTVGDVKQLSQDYPDFAHSYELALNKQEVKIVERVMNKSMTSTAAGLLLKTLHGYGHNRQEESEKEEEIITRVYLPGWEQDAA